MPTVSLRALYLATVEGGLDAFLRDHPDLVTTDVVSTLENDFQSALDYGDLDAASLSAEAAARVHAALGDLPESVARYLDLIHLQARRARSMPDLLGVRRSALVVASMTVDADLPSALAECWLVVCTADLRLVDLARSADQTAPRWMELLIDLLRCAADLGELFARIPVWRRELDQLRRYVNLLDQIWGWVPATDWPAYEVVGVRALIVRLCLACTDIVDRGTASADHPDPSAVAWVRTALTRMALHLGE